MSSLSFPPVLSQPARSLVPNSVSSSSVQGMRLPSFERLLREHLARHAGACVVRICVQDHLWMDQPHIHARLNTLNIADEPLVTPPQMTQSEWVTIGIRGEHETHGGQLTSGAVMRALQAIARDANVRVDRTLTAEVQICLHTDENGPHQPAAAKRTAPEFLELLWSTSRTLTPADAAALHARDDAAACPICLNDMRAGEELVCLPCDGEHLGHWACLSQWLASRAT